MHGVTISPQEVQEPKKNLSSKAPTTAKKVPKWLFSLSVIDTISSSVIPHALIHYNFILKLLIEIFDFAQQILWIIIFFSYQLAAKDLLPMELEFSHCEFLGAAY